MKKILLAAMACSMLLVSCSDFLDHDNDTALSEQQVFSKLDNIDPYIQGLITSWRNLEKDRGGLRFSLGNDETQQGAYQVQTDPDQAELDRYNGYKGAENSAITVQWSDRWPVVSGAARCIYYLNLNTEADAARRDLLIGEASFLRAAEMFELAMYWGKIPVLDMDHTEEYGYKRQPLDLVYSYIVNDLQTAMAKLPSTQQNHSLPTKWIAQALLGKVYMSAPQESGYRDFNLAKEQFQAVVSSGQFMLLPSYANLFDPNYANNQESLYEWQFNNTYPDNNQIQWQTGSRAVANLDQYAYFGGYDLLVPTQYCYKMQADGGVWETGDTRKNVSIRYDFTYQGTSPPLPSPSGGDELDPHIKKYEDIRTQSSQSFWNSGKNKAFIRYADVLLSLAECLNELGQTADGETYVNQVRTRAFGGNLPTGMAWSGLSQQQFRDQILDERMRELAFEGWRRMDLIRTDKFVQLISTRNKWAMESGSVDENHKLYPIPLKEIKQNDEIGPEDQNPGY